jgi:hypothetical protein
VDPPSHDISIVLAYTSKYSIKSQCVQGVILPYKNRIKIYIEKTKETLKCQKVKIKLKIKNKIKLRNQRLKI